MAEEKDDVAGETLAWAFSFPSIGGGRLDFASFRGRVLLVANTASFCGYTYQYEGLEKLHAAKAAAGLTVVGVPSQDFNQESADDATVKAFCQTRIQHRFSADRPFACAWCAGGTVLCLGERPAELATSVEFQQSADRAQRSRRGDIRIDRRAGWFEVVSCHRNGVVSCGLIVRRTEQRIKQQDGSDCTFRIKNKIPLCYGTDETGHMSPLGMIADPSLLRQSSRCGVTPCALRSRRPRPRTWVW